MVLTTNILRRFIDKHLKGRLVKSYGGYFYSGNVGECNRYYGRSKWFLGFSLESAYVELKFLLYLKGLVDLSATTKEQEKKDLKMIKQEFYNMHQLKGLCKQLNLDMSVWSLDGDIDGKESAKIEVSEGGYLLVSRYYERYNEASKRSACASVLDELECMHSGSWDGLLGIWKQVT